MNSIDFKCVICEDTKTPKRINDTVKGDKKNALKVFACAQCGHIQLHPPLYSLQYYNQDDQVNFVVHDYGTPLERLIEHSWVDARRRVERFDEKGILLENSPQLKVIDVGGGYGFFGSEMKHAFPDAEVLVLEPSALRIEKGLEYLKNANKALPTFMEGLLDQDFVSNNEGKYDVVSLWHVLEHVPDPVQLLKDASRIAKKNGGIVCVELPNAGDELIKLSSAFKDRSFMIEHISYFDKNMLERVAHLAAPEGKCTVYGYQRYGIFNYFNWVYKNAPLGENPDLLEGNGRWWLEKVWKISRESAHTSDALFMVINL